MERISFAWTAHRPLIPAYELVKELSFQLGSLSLRIWNKYQAVLGVSLRRLLPS